MRALVCDFDGTIVKHDLAESLLKKFAKEGWEQYDTLMEKSEITLEECIKYQFGMIQANSEKALLDYVEDFCKFRAGFIELLNYCDKNNVKVTVASAGIDFCVRFAFKTQGVKVPDLVIPHSRFTIKGLRVSFEQSWKRNTDSSNFKAGVVAGLKQKGYKVSFVGDGFSDVPAAAAADFVFAIKGSRLDSECSKRTITYVPITDFYPLIEHLRMTGAV